MSDEPDSAKEKFDELTTLPEQYHFPLRRVDRGASADFIYHCGTSSSGSELDRKRLHPKRLNADMPSTIESG